MGYTHLFISYATEDAALANWLSRKLVSAGYAVWYDRLKMLGGEPWPQTIEDAIKNRTFRMVALLSKSSISKPNPSKERTAALAIARQRGIPDFLIPLKVDDAELDWLTSDISYITFSRGWAEGLRQLLKKLKDIDAPRVLAEGAAIAASSLHAFDDVVVEGREEIFANAMPLHIPDLLQGYSFSPGVDVDLGALSQAWAFRKTEYGKTFALSPPPPEYAAMVKQTKQKISWRDFETIEGIRSRDLVASLAIKEVEVRLLNRGFTQHATQKGVFFLDGTTTEDGLLHFAGIGGKKTWLKVRGTASFLRPGSPKEKNEHCYALRISLARGLDKGIWLQVTPTLVFFGTDGLAINDKRAGARRKKLSKSWWNNKWANRLLAAECLFLQNLDSEEPLFGGRFLRFAWNAQLNEDALSPLPSGEHDNDNSTHVESKEEAEVEN